MKKIQLDSAKLQLKKNKIANLTNEQMNDVNGGFTYSLSTGERCRASQAVGAGNPYDCGAVLSALQNCVQPAQPVQPGIGVQVI